MKNAEVKGLIDAMNGFTSANLSLSPKMWYTLTKNRKELLDADKLIEDSRIELVKKFAEPDGEGNVQVPDNKMQEFTREYAELLNLDTDLKLSTIPLDEVEKSLEKISGVNNIYLFFEHMITEK